MAASYCICSILPYSAVENLVEMHPEAFTTLVQTMVRMYHLKPDIGWYELTTKIVKKARVFNDEDAFQWFRLQDEKPDPEELHAKAFDLACRKLTVSHLDRRIFWSELDRDASGGISFEEFKGKLLFKEVCGDMPQQHSQLAGASNTASSEMLGIPSRSASLCSSSSYCNFSSSRDNSLCITNSRDTSLCSRDLAMVRALSQKSNGFRNSSRQMSPDAALSATTSPKNALLQEQVRTMSPEVPSSSAVPQPSSSILDEKVDRGMSLEALVEQNQRLVQEVIRLCL